MTDLTNAQKTAYDLAKQYQASKVRSANENVIRADIRGGVEKLGIDPRAFQTALRMAEDMTLGERGDYTTSLNDVLTILDGKESDLFGEEEMRKRDERKAKAAEKAAKAGRTPAELDAKTDTDPKSDPAKGGAGKKRGRPSKAELTASAAAAANQAAEQDEGGEVLDGAIDGMKKSQSTLAAEARAKADLN